MLVLVVLYNSSVQESLETLAFSAAPVASGRLAGRDLLAAGGKDGKVSLWDVYGEA